MKFGVGKLTDIGRKRSQNQDNIASCPDLALFVVADGMGGHRGGEIASAMVVDLVPLSIRTSVQREANWNPKKIITEAIEKASRSIFERSIKEPALQGMGTTTVAMLFKDGKLTIGHVGDSRCYYFKKDAVWQLTRDHSLVQEKLRAGLIARDAIKTDRMKNVITRSVGFESSVLVEIYEMEARKGDLFMLCSDGLSGMLEDPDILEIVHNLLGEGAAADDGSHQRAVDQLVSAANARGGDDNISVILVEILE